MKSIRTDPRREAVKGDERIRTAARWLSTAYRYVRCGERRHRWVFVGDQSRKLNDWTTVGWNYECSRCGKTSSRSGAAS